jgi:hypothetical protein
LPEERLPKTTCPETTPYKLVDEPDKLDTFDG